MNAEKIVGIRTLKLKLFDYFCKNVLSYFHWYASKSATCHTDGIVALVSSKMIIKLIGLTKQKKGCSFVASAKIEKET